VVSITVPNHNSTYKIATNANLKIIDLVIGGFRYPVIDDDDDEDDDDDDDEYPCSYVYQYLSRQQA